MSTNYHERGHGAWKHCMKLPNFVGYSGLGKMGPVAAFISLTYFFTKFFSLFVVFYNLLYSFKLFLWALRLLCFFS